MSHEIRTPLNGVLGMVSLLKDTPLNDEQNSFLQTMEASGHGLLTVVNDILDYSKIEAGQVQLELLPFSPKMDGVTATKKILELNKAHPNIIALTANAMEEDRNICIQPGMNDIITKPIQRRKLTEVLIKFSKQIKNSNAS